MSAQDRLPVIFIQAADQSWVFFMGSMRYYRDAGIEPILVSSPGPLMNSLSDEESVQKEAVPIERDPAPIKDLRSLIELFRMLRRRRPVAVVAATPKGSMLGLLAARLAGVRVRIYHHYGLRLETESGVRRAMLRAFEEFTALNSTAVVFVSPSLKRVAERYVRVLRSRRGIVLGSGSSHGVDLERYAAQVDGREKPTFRVGYVGRLNVDKGMSDLLEAFEGVLDQLPDARLVIAGGGDGDDLRLTERLKESVDLHRTRH